MSSHLPDLIPAESHIQIWHMYAEVVAGNALARTNNASQLFGHYVSQSAAAQHDHVAHPLYLKAGTWELRMLYLSAPSGAQCALTLTGEEDLIQHFGATVEMWANPGVFSLIYSTSLTLPRDQLYRLRGRATTKNAASGGYQMNITSFNLWRTGS